MDRGPETYTAMANSMPTQELLLLCIRGGKAEHWETLISRVQPLIARTAYRVAASAGSARVEEVDDIVQETCLKLGSTRTAQIAAAALQSEASAFAYIKVMALNTARDYFRKKHRSPATPESDLPVPIDQFAATMGSDVDRDILYSQIDSALGRLDHGERSRTVFWLYYRQGLTAKEISQIPEVQLTTKGVESMLDRLTKSVRSLMATPPEKGKATAGAL